MTHPSDPLTKIRGYIGKLQEINPRNRDAALQTIGLSGEYITQCLLERFGVRWMKFDQCKNTYSQNLVYDSFGKRPDYLISIDGQVAFLDSKFIKLEDVSGGRRAKLEESEVSKQKVTSNLFGVPTIYIIWGRNLDGLRYVFEYVDNFTATVTEGTKVYRYVDFNDSDFTEMLFS